jgi:hypothetical protein
MNMYMVNELFFSFFFKIHILDQRICNIRFWGEKCDLGEIFEA